MRKKWLFGKAPKSRAMEHCHSLVSEQVLGHFIVSATTV